jgi:heme/copper-type cytochrome/quinol oxidase subunit 2
MLNDYRMLMVVVVVVLFVTGVGDIVIVEYKERRKLNQSQDQRRTAWGIQGGRRWPQAPCPVGNYS